MSYFKVSLAIFVVLAASRFIPHPPNFTSLIALSFYYSWRLMEDWDDNLWYNNKYFPKELN